MFGVHSTQLYQAADAFHTAATTISTGIDPISPQIPATVLGKAAGAKELVSAISEFLTKQHEDLLLGTRWLNSTGKALQASADTYAHAEHYSQELFESILAQLGGK